MIHDLRIIKLNLRKIKFEKAGSNLGMLRHLIYPFTHFKMQRRDLAQHSFMQLEMRNSDHFSDFSYVDANWRASILQVVGMRDLNKTFYDLFISLCNDVNINVYWVSHQAWIYEAFSV